MPNFLRLIDRETGQAHEGRALIEVDEKLCAGLGVACDEKSFYLGWVDWDSLYLTEDWAKVKEWHKESSDRAKAVIDWLDAHYTLAGYAMIGRC